MFAFIDTIPDLQFFSIFIGMLVATFAAEWIVGVREKRGSGKTNNLGG
jgi:hypothetical protein